MPSMPTSLPTVLLLAAPLLTLAGIPLPVAPQAADVTARSSAEHLRGAARDLPWAAFWAGTTVELAQMYSTVMASANVSEADPLWERAKALVGSASRLTPDGGEFQDLCKAGALANYTALGCSIHAPGSALIAGNSADAYFCGSNASGINWSGANTGSGGEPVADLCHARPGTAYDADGICGRWSTKQLLLNFFDTIPMWSVDPLTINIPSVDCLLGLGDCDIHYCQHCPGRCGSP